MTTRTPDARDVLERLAQEIEKDPWLIQTVSKRLPAAIRRAATLPEPGAAGEALSGDEVLGYLAKVKSIQRSSDSIDTISLQFNTIADADAFHGWLRYHFMRLRQRASQEGGE